jgi:hypothetical protein
LKDWDLIDTITMHEISTASAVITAYSSDRLNVKTRGEPLLLPDDVITHYTVNNAHAQLNDFSITKRGPNSLQ